MRTVVELATVRCGSVLAWMDLEMTGLDPVRNVIVEIATIVTDDELNIVAEGPDLVIGATPEQLADMDDVVRRMHTTSGLLTAIGKSTVTSKRPLRPRSSFSSRRSRRRARCPCAGTRSPWIAVS